jgi:hypothetical protein
MPRLKDRNAWVLKAFNVKADPTASKWLKEALMEAINCDAVSVAKDAEILREILQMRAAVAEGATDRGGKEAKPAKTDS